MKNLNIKDIPTKLQPLLQKVRQYIVLIYIVVFALALSFLVFRINILAQSEPSEDAIAEKLKGVKRPKIDQSAIDKIEALKDTNVEVQTLFKQARENPFQE